MSTSSPTVLLLAWVVGVVVGAATTWLAVRARYAADLAAASARRELLAQQVEDLRRRDEDDDAVRATLAPLTSTLARVERQVGALERDRQKQYGQLGERLGEVATSTKALRAETASLAGSLNASTTRGVWGETQLRRLLEHAGLVNRCDFEEQVSGVTRDDVAVRPDAVVRLPGGKSLVIDAKAPLTAFLRAQGDVEDDERRRQLRAHAVALRGHVDALARKEYWTAFSPAPEMVVCFVPADAVLAAAIDADPSLYDDAMSRRVVLSSPATLIALLRTVAYTWQQEALTENARELLELGRDLYARLATLGGHVSKMGTALRRSVETYNGMVGALESRVLVTARRMHALGLTDDEPLTMPVVDAAPRPLTAAELLDHLDDGPDRRDAATIESAAVHRVTGGRRDETA